MGTLNLANLPSQARYESSCRVRTSLEDRPQLFPPLRSRDGVTVYLTSSGDVCLYNDRASGVPPARIFNLSDVSAVAYTEKKVKDSIPFHASTIFIAFCGLIMFYLNADMLYYYVQDFNNIYNWVPEGNVADAVSSDLNLFSDLSILIPILLCLLGFFVVPDKLVDRMGKWSSPESLHFKLKDEETISFYGKFPNEGRIRIYGLGIWAFLLIFFPLYLGDPHTLPPFIALEAILISGVIIADRTVKMVIHEPDENEGSVEIRGLKGFHDDLLGLSPPTGRAVGKKGTTPINFEHLVDRLSDDVSGLKERLERHERALSEATKDKWIYTLTVPEVDQGLNQIRKCAERVLFQRVEDLGISPGTRVGLTMMRSIFVQNKVVTDAALSDIDVILAKSGTGSHAARGYADNDDDYIMALTALVNLVEWHFDHPVEAPAVLPEAN